MSFKFYLIFIILHCIGPIIVTSRVTGIVGDSKEKYL